MLKNNRRHTHIRPLLAAALGLLCAAVGHSDFLFAGTVPADRYSYPVVDTGQSKCYVEAASDLQTEDPQLWQDAHYAGPQPAYQDKGDGTVSDLVTGLMWVRARGEKVSWEDAVSGARTCRIGGYDDWRVPGIKELYSLIDFNGGFRRSAAHSRPYINVEYFDFKYGDEARGERGIDCQDWSATEYVSTTMNGSATVFGVNFADGRIKGYPRLRRGPQGRTTHRLYVRYVRGNPRYGQNDFLDNQDGTVTDRATGLVWSQADSGRGMDWFDALSWVKARNQEKYLGYDDWRLPNAKELQSIVDYTRSPDTSASPAIDPIFQCTEILNDGGQKDYPFYWTSTTHLDNRGGVYIAFGRALGWMQMPPQSGQYRLQDVHGAGAQRSDPKRGHAADYPRGKGPQGDVIRINNYVRLVRGGGVRVTECAEVVRADSFSNPEEQGRGREDFAGQGGERPAPPPEAVAACQGHREGESVEFSSPHGLVRGTCQMIQGQMACVPTDGARGAGRPGRR